MDVNSTLANNINNLNGYNGENNSSLYDNKDVDIRVQATKNIANESKIQEDGSNVKEEYSKKELDDALKKVNNFLKDEKTHAEYSIHDDLGTLMIKIVDDNSKKTILEIPPKSILDMVASMCKQVGLLDRKA